MTLSPTGLHSWGHQGLLALYKIADVGNALRQSTKAGDSLGGRRRLDKVAELFVDGWDIIFSLGC